ncbi:MAG: hypothetical protein SGILL_007667 [Bacillariaceae sp.]
MTSWVWMKDFDEKVADPIEPVTSHDDRPAVKDLIEEHRDKIDKIQAAIAEDPLYDPTKHDDLWMLRFWLSHKKSKDAIAAAKATLLFRKKYDLDKKDIRKKLPHTTDEPRCKEYWEVRCKGDGIICALPDKKRGVVMFLKFAQMDPGAANVLSDDVWDYAFVYTSEWSHQWLDYITRTTGRLTKSVRLIDMTDLSFTKHMDRASMNRDSKIMNEMEDVYPQLLETIFACYPPSFMHKVWAFIRPIMPKRIIDKIDLIEPSINEEERERLFKHMTIESLPEHYGGKNKVPPKDWKLGKKGKKSKK